MNSLSMSDIGAYLVRTASGTLYDLEIGDGASTLHRRPSDQEPDLTLADASKDMRRDGETVDLLAIPFCEVGHSAIFGVNLGLESGAFTARRTTSVVSITKVAPELPAAESLALEPAN